MDPGAAISGISSDVAGVVGAFGPFGLVLVALIFGLPIASFLAALRGIRLALIPLAGSVAFLFAWVLYYATGRWQVEAGAVIPAAGAIVVGWITLVVALLQERHRASLSLAAADR